MKQNNNELDIISFFTNRLGIAPEERQREVLRCESNRVIVNCSRQWGKSTLAAAPTERQSGEFVRKVKGLAALAGERVRGEGHNRVSLRLGNEATVRGFSAVSLLIVDEASRVTDEMNRALRPMLAVSDVDLWLMNEYAFGETGVLFTPRGSMA